MREFEILRPRDEVWNKKSQFKFYYWYVTKRCVRWSFVYFLPIKNFKLMDTHSGSWQSVLYVYMGSLWLALRLRFLNSNFVIIFGRFTERT
jgi:hypothetical protein